MPSLPPRQSGPPRQPAATAHAAFAFPVAGSASGAAHFRGHLCVRLRYSLETRHHPADGAVEGFRDLVSRPPALRATGLWLFPGRFPPAEHAAFAGRTTGRETFASYGLSTCGPSPCTIMKHLFPFRGHPRTFIRVSSHCTNMHQKKTLVHSLRVRWVLCAPLLFVLHTPQG